MQSSIVMISLDIVVWQQCPACSSAGEAHLFRDTKTQVLEEMKAVRHLRRLRGHLHEQPARIARIDLD